jgi:nifR3 family TIM-barrel protein
VANVWSKFKKQVKESDPARAAYVLAPMADVTDSAFRQIISKYGRPDVFYTEFVSCDGLMSLGREKLLRELTYAEVERPIVAQVFGSRPENFYKTAELIAELGFDGIDINMGCPERNIQKQGACADLINQPELAKEIILATKEGAGDLPVSVKTRIGYNRINLEEWAAHLLETKPAAITFHWRTKKEMSKVPAHWDLAPIAVEMAKDTETLILGNGDVGTLAEAREIVKQYKVDGVMIGRGIFGNPWLFAERDDIPLAEKLNVMIEHTKLFEQIHPHKNFAIMKKHYKAYVNGFSGASALRAKLMEAESASEVEKITLEFLAPAMI